MVRVITLEREYGSRGGEFAALLAARLGWRLLDDALVAEVARRAGVAPELVRQSDERLDPWYTRFGRGFWHGNVERLPAPAGAPPLDGGAMAKLAAECIRETAGAGGAVIVGRGASSILSGFPGAFHLFVFASTARRKRWVEEHVPGADAGRLLPRVDGNRARYVREHYGHAWDDHRLYHLMLNSCMGLEAMLLATLAAAGEDPSRWPGRDRRSACGPAGSSRGAAQAAGGMGAGLA